MKREHGYWGSNKGGEFWGRLTKVMPEITRRVIGKSYTLRQIVAHIEKTQGRKVTANKLIGRADSLVRYNETHPMTKLVQAAYREIRG
jgi:hypothetical protein